MYGPHYKIPIAYETAPSVTTDSTAPPEIVVTPAMRQAGADAIDSLEGRDSMSTEFLVELAYRAMAQKLMEERGR